MTSSYLFDWQQQPQQQQRRPTPKNVTRVDHDVGGDGGAPSFPLTTTTTGSNYLDHQHHRPPRQLSATCRISSAKITRVMSYNKQRQLTRRERHACSHNDLASSARGGCAAEWKRETLPGATLSGAAGCLASEGEQSCWQSELMVVPPPPPTAPPPPPSLSLSPLRPSPPPPLTSPLTRAHVPRPPHLVDTCPKRAGHWSVGRRGKNTTFISSPPPPPTASTSKGNHNNIYRGQISTQDDDDSSNTDSNSSSTLSSTITNCTSSSQSVTDFESDDEEDYDEEVEEEEDIITSDEAKQTEVVATRHTLQLGWCCSLLSTFPILYDRFDLSIDSISLKLVTFLSLTYFCLPTLRIFRTCFKLVLVMPTNIIIFFISFPLSLFYAQATSPRKVTRRSVSSCSPPTSPRPSSSRW